MPNIPDISATSKPQLQFCRICWEAAELGTGKTDENGQANHEECNDRQRDNSVRRRALPRRKLNDGLRAWLVPHTTLLPY
jgi:hypothetical protein